MLFLDGLTIFLHVLFELFGHLVRRVLTRAATRDIRKLLACVKFEEVPGQLVLMSL